MGLDYTKTISSLKKQTSGENAGRIGLFKATAVSFLILFVFSLVLSSPPEEELSWSKKLEQDFQSRYNWMDNSIFSFASGERYQNFAQGIVGMVDSELAANTDNQEAALIDVKLFFKSAKRAIISGTLRLGFILMAFWPFWIIASLAGFFVANKLLRPKASTSVLGFCTNGLGPFYSGIYGALRPNKSISGTDYTCPGLACPNKAKTSLALNHQLVKILKKHKALNQTNIELVRVILAYKDYPTFVEEESPDIDPHQSDQEESSGALDKGFITNEKGTIEQSSVEGLDAILYAHHALRVLYKNIGKKSPKYAEYTSKRNKILAKVRPLTKTLIQSLTQKRSEALIKLSPQMVATAYLATEAGKSLVYKRSSDRFTQISRYPNLQARAVVQSLNEYNIEYKGDQRLMVRNAIICSRRHGDFGRAFLPSQMPLESRGLRDLLEILYTESSKREEKAKIVELDAQIEEVHNNWSKLFTEKLKQEASKVDKDYSWWKGVPYKSVVFVPLRASVSFALNGLEEERINHIYGLIKFAKDFDLRASGTARLPGFKKQLALEQEEAGDVLKKLLNSKGGKSILTRWVITRRMLTRFNWLSTRIGDDAVPASGLAQIIINEQNLSSTPVSVAFDAIVPIRQRRFRELFGEYWERDLYSDSPHPKTVNVHLNASNFNEGMKTTNAILNLGTYSESQNNAKVA